jgi:hypothetical protein
MSYRIIWRERILQNVHNYTFLALERGRDPDALVRAVAEINRRLTTNPHTQGESRGSPERILIVHPLTVIFEVFEEARIVLIYAAVYYPRMRA